MLVLDANILVWAVLGRRVRNLNRQVRYKLCFFVPDVALNDAREHLPIILGKRGIPPGPALRLLDELCPVIDVVEFDIYAPFETAGRSRLAGRDEEDWPILATALALDCPIWTEDTDFFGIGVPTWTTDRIELFLKAAAGVE